MIERSAKDDPFGLRSAADAVLRWHSPSLSIVGLGVAARIPIERSQGPAGAADAQTTFAQLASTFERTVLRAGSTGAAGLSAQTTPIAFAAMPFDPRSRAELIVPAMVLVETPDGGAVVAAADGVSVDEALDRFAADRVVPPQPCVYTMRSVVPPEEWRDTIVAPVRDRIVAGHLVKAVLARELTVDADRPIDIDLVVDRLRSTHPGTYVFSIDGFVGASPELLVERNASGVRAHPLAGTASRQADPIADDRAAAALLASVKDRWEHRITIDWLLDELLPFCSYVDAEPEPSVVSLPNVHHLGTRVEGRLSTPEPSILELVAALHPTPAVAGSPQASALAEIATYERADRGRYGGPVGWVDETGNGEFAVGIRSAEVSGSRATVFAGVGVVADSDPESELAETRAKFQAMLGALMRP